MSQKTQIQVEQIDGKTRLTNLNQIADNLGRSTEELAKMFQLYRQVSIRRQKDGNYDLGTNIAKDLLEHDLQTYIQHFVICPNCAGSKTQYVTHGSKLGLNCDECGQKNRLYRDLQNEIDAKLTRYIIMTQCQSFR